MRYFEKLAQRFPNLNRLAARRGNKRQTRLMFESLEKREVLAASPMATVGIGPINTVSGSILDTMASTESMTQLAQQMISSGQLKAPSAPTYLYLNFDGWNNCQYNGNQDVTAFSGTSAEVDSILYRTAEEFAPFNVIVQQI